MTRRILKWSIPVDDRDHPMGAGTVVHVACQNHPGAVEVWTDEPDAEHVTTTSARVYGTGQPLPQHDEVLGSTVVLNGLVWHVLRRRVERVATFARCTYPRCISRAGHIGGHVLSDFDFDGNPTTPETS